MKRLKKVKKWPSCLTRTLCNRVKSFLMKNISFFKSVCLCCCDLMKSDFKLYESQQNKHTIFKLWCLKRVYCSVLGFNFGAFVVWITEFSKVSWKNILWKTRTFYSERILSHCYPANCRTVCCFTSPDFHFLL